jgi:hypothetical protein
LIRAAFLAEIGASRHIVTLDQLNEAFVAWATLEYNGRVHGQTGETPLARWQQAAQSVRYAEEEALRRAFLFEEKRTPDKAGVFSLCGVLFQVGPTLARRRISIRFDPEALTEVEVFRDGQFVQRAWPLVVHADRRPWQHGPRTEKAASTTQVDWLSHLVNKRRQEGIEEPSARAFAEAARKRRQDLDDAVVAVLRERLHKDSFDEEAARQWLASFGPLDPNGTAAALDTRLSLGEPNDRHVTHYLQAVGAALNGDPS